MAEFTQPHGISYPVASDRIKDPNAVAKLADDIKATAVTTNDAISAEGARAENAAVGKAIWNKGLIPNGSDIREYMYGKPGQYGVLSGASTATMTGLPDELVKKPLGFTAISSALPTGGTHLELSVYDVWGNHKYHCNSAPAASSNDGWTRWSKYKWDEGATDDPGNSSGSGTKVLPLILTAGRGGGEALGPTSATVKYDVNISSSINVVRYRFAIRDGNPRWGTKTAQTINMTGIKFGGVAKLSSFATNSDGSISYSPWMTGNFGSMEFSYACTQGPRLIIGGGTIDGVRKTEMPFELWLECEIPASTAAVGLIGDSNSVAVNATIPVHDSWMQIYCRRMGFFPVLYGHSGDNMASSADPGHYKWTRWDHLDKPDLVIHANGANDLIEPTTLAELQEEAQAEWEMSGQKISANRHTALIKSKPSGDNNAARVAYNSWLKTYPEPTREWHDIASPVTANDTGGILPQYLSSDGLHMNTAGQQAIADSLNKPMTIRSSLVFSETAGRTVKAWDYLNQRDQLIYGDTGIRNVSAWFASPATINTAQISRTGNIVTLAILSLTPNMASQGDILAGGVIPIGFRPPLDLQGWAVINDVNKRPYDGAFFVRSNGGARYYAASLTQRVNFTISWRTDEPWPSSLPGTAVGVIPN